VLKKNNIYTLLVAFLCIISTRVYAQNVTVDASIDSIQRFIGEQARIKLEVSCDASRSIHLPQFVDTLVAGVEIIDIVKADTQYLNNRERMMVTQEYIVTSFDSASYYIPPFEVMVDGQIHHSQSLALMVYPMPLDEDNPESIFPPKDIMQLPLAWVDWKPVIWKLPILFAIIIAAIYLIIRYRDNKPIIRKVKVEPKLPPHEQALLDIDRIKAEKSWQKGDPKGYYTELTDVIRMYIHGRFGFNAMEKTSSEIIDYLKETKDKEGLEDLKQLFMTADLVKFAKYAPLLNENDMNLVSAIEFINQTKVEVDPNEKPAPTEITIEEKRSKRTKVVLIVGIVTLVVLAMVVIYFVGSDLYNLFF
jgi:hypothetical protein